MISLREFDAGCNDSEDADLDLCSEFFLHVTLWIGDVLGLDGSGGCGCFYSSFSWGVDLYFYSNFILCIETLWDGDVLGFSNNFLAEIVVIFVLVWYF